MKTLHALFVLSLISTSLLAEPFRHYEVPREFDSLGLIVEEREGVPYIAKVERGSPIYGQVQPNDRILEVNHEYLDESGEYRKIVDKMKPQRVSKEAYLLTIRREGTKTRDFKVLVNAMEYPKRYYSPYLSEEYLESFSNEVARLRSTHVWTEQEDSLLKRVSIFLQLNDAYVSLRKEVEKDPEAYGEATHFFESMQRVLFKRIAEDIQKCQARDKVLNDFFAPILEAMERQVDDGTSVRRDRTFKNLLNWEVYKAETQPEKR